MFTPFQFRTNVKSDRQLCYTCTYHFCRGKKAQVYTLLSTCTVQPRLSELAGTRQKQSDNREWMIQVTFSSMYLCIHQGEVFQLPKFG